MRRLLPFFIVALVAGGIFGWKTGFSSKPMPLPPAPPVEPAAPVQPALQAPPKLDVLYRWVDKDGVTHYAQQAGHKSATRLEYDGSRITPLPPADAALVERVSAVANNNAQPAKQAEGKADPEPRQGKGSLHDLRRELQKGVEQMQAGKAARHPSNL